MSGAELWERLAGVAPMMLRALLADLRLLSFDGSVARIACPPTVRAVAEKKLADLGALAGSLTGTRVAFELSVSEAGDDAGSADPAASGQVGSDDAHHDDEPGASDTDHPVVRLALETFNGRILDIKPIRKKPGSE